MSIIELLDYIILQKIFIEARNPNLSKVSKTFYHISHEINTQANYYEKWSEQTKNRCMMCRHSKMFDKRELILALLNRGLIRGEHNFGEILRRAVEYGWLDVNQTDTKTDFLVYSHSKLAAHSYNRCMYSAMVHKNLVLVKHILDSVDIEQNRFELYCYYLIPCKGTEMIKIMYDYADKNGLDIPEMVPISLSDVDAMKYSESRGEKIMDNIDDRLEIAILRGNFEIVKFLVDLGADIYYESLEYVRLALAYGEIEILIYLCQKIGVEYLDNGVRKRLINCADIRLKNFLIDFGINIHIFQDLMLHNSAYNYDYEVTKKLLELGANMYLRNSKVLRDAIIKRDEKFVKLVLSYGNKPHPNMTKEFLELCEEGNVGIASLLIEHDKHIHPHLNSILYKLVYSGKMECVELLLKNGANVNTNGGMSLLKYAVNKNKRDLVELLLEHNVKINYKDKSLIHKTFEKGYNDLAEKILQKNVLERVELGNKLISACHRNNTELVKLILKYSNADQKMDLVNTNHGSALCIAVRNSNEEMKRMFLDSGAIINTKNRKLFVDSCRYGYENIVNTFLEYWKAKKMRKKIKKLMNKCILEAFEYGNYGLYEQLISPEIIDRGDIFEFTKSRVLQLACDRGEVSYARDIIFNLSGKIDFLDSRTLTNSYMLKREEIFDFIVGFGEVNKNISNYEFIKGCNEGDLGTVERMLVGGTNVGVFDELGLKLASRNGDIKMVRFLVRKGAKFGGFSVSGGFFLLQSIDYEYDCQKQSGN
ncbi:hypothetical protein BB559_003725 [Furculomyces boomerangus]|uniref:Uncharacterized protein n=1 Tax=Furculomyces boomerangus TaxID=61424 RepID=A0A2T9YJB1_9FUNG|nr:hypothetical protein BB559_003725 [Furculomyces boomerangus]